MLDTDLKQQLAAYLERVTLPFEMVASLDDGDKSKELKELLQEMLLEEATPEPELNGDGSLVAVAIAVLLLMRTLASASPSGTRMKG